MTVLTVLKIHYRCSGCVGGHIACNRIEHNIRNDDNIIIINCCLDHCQRDAITLHVYVKINTRSMSYSAILL